MSHIVAAKVLKPDMLDKYGKYVPYVLGTAAIGALGVGAYFLYKKFGEPVGDVLNIPSSIVEGITNIVDEGKFTKEEATSMEKTMQDAYDLSLTRLNASSYWNALESLGLSPGGSGGILYTGYELKGQHLQDAIDKKQETLTLQEEIDSVMSFNQEERDALSKAKSDALAQMQANIDKAKAEQALKDAEQRSLEEQRKIDQAIDFAETQRGIDAEKAEIVARERDRQIQLEVDRQQAILDKMRIDEQFKINRLIKIEEEEVRVEPVAITPTKPEPESIEAQIEPVIKQIQQPDEPKRVVRSGVIIE